MSKLLVSRFRLGGAGFSAHGQTEQRRPRHAGCPWRVFRVSGPACTGSGDFWRVSRVAVAPCRHFATGTRETCRGRGETPARRFGKSGNLPPKPEIAARRPANSENLPALGELATAARQRLAGGEGARVRQKRRAGAPCQSIKPGINETNWLPCSLAIACKEMRHRTYMRAKKAPISLENRGWM